MRALLTALLSVVQLPTARVCEAQTAVSPLRAAPVTMTAQDEDALGRLAYAEAGNQGASGLAGVVFTVLNRVASGRFGDNVQSVIEAPGQFAAVTQAGGRWRDLTPLTPLQSASFKTILDLTIEGRLPDPTKGATFFQNPKIVASHEAEGLVSPGLTNFGASAPIAVIKDHAFYDHVTALPAQKAPRTSWAQRHRTLWLDIRHTENGIDIVRLPGAHTPRKIQIYVFHFAQRAP
jgi:N-acetylmuramoyl-L-alanine amidase